MSFARSTLLYLPAQLFGPLTQFIATVLWTHLVGPAPFGIVTFVIAAQELTGATCLLWWSIFVMRFQSRHVGGDGARFRSMDLRMVLGGVAVQAALAVPSLAVIGAPLSWPLLGATFLYFAARTPLNHYGEWARARNAIATYSVAQIGAPVLGSSFSIMAALWISPDPATVLAAIGVGQALTLAAVLILLRVPLRLGAFDRKTFADAWRYGSPLVVSGIFLWLGANVVRVVVQYFGGAEEAGVFSAGWGIGQRLAVVVGMLCTAASFPLAVQKLERGDREGAARQVANNFALMAALLAPAAVGIAFLAPALSNLAVAAPFREATRIVLPLALLSGALRVMRIHTGDQLCLLYERTRTSMLFNALDAGLTVAAVVAGDMLAGYQGAAMGALAASAAAFVAMGVYAVGALGFKPPWLALGRIALGAAAVAALLAISPQPQDWARVALLIGQCGVAYFALAALLFRDEARALRAGLA